MKNLRKQMIVFIVLLTGILTINSCSKDDDGNLIEDNPCKDEIIGEYYLLENSKNSVPYNEDLRLYFKDATGNQVNFEVTKSATDYPQYIYALDTQCEYDSSQKKYYITTGEAYFYDIKEPLESLGVSFDLFLGNGFFGINDIKIFDQLKFSMDYSNENNCSEDNISILINSNQLTDERVALYPKSTFINEVTLLNKTFEDVYVGSDEKIYYNYEVGLIGFKDQADNLWVFDKVEELKN